MCFLKVHSWIKFYLFSISICVMLRQSTTQSRASTITSLFLLVVSITSEKSLLHFCLIPTFPSVVGVIENFYVVRCDHFFVGCEHKVWWTNKLMKVFYNDEFFFKKSSMSIHSLELKLLHCCRMCVHLLDSLCQEALHE